MLLIRNFSLSHSLYSASLSTTNSESSTEPLSPIRENVPAKRTKSPPKLPDPERAASRQQVRALLRRGIMPIGSRRRRAALNSSANIPFEQLPFQCFQEARKVLAADREEKLGQIEIQRARIIRLKEQDPSISGGVWEKARRLDSMQKQLEKLKILADINDPLIKKRFEDGDGDMNRPIYRYLADKKWRSYRRLVIVQRIQQMKIVPDVLRHMDITADVYLAFLRHHVSPGDFVDSNTSETTPRLKVQVFDKGERMVSVAIIDSDVPDVERDCFNHRCHFLASNIPLSPVNTSLPLSMLSKESQIILPWLPPFAQKGSPYHRLSTIILQHPKDKAIDVETMRQRTTREGFSLQRWAAHHKLTPIGAHLFRSKWDEGTAGVMTKAGEPGADIELRRKRVEPLLKKKKLLPVKKRLSKF
ncbi:MAG: hypothetical protein M1829_004276 [Trizodia sp. TS-e1964]|nr:MAG: hypothetical protein M1829_004276 [Trizodia sp. TS-e1964]